MEHIVDYLSGLLASNQLFQGGIVLAAISWAFYQLKAWPLLLWQKLKYWASYHVYFDDSNEFYLTFTEWFAETHPQKFRNVEVRFSYNSDGENQSQGISAPTATPSSRDRDSEGWVLKWFQYNDNNVVFYNNRLLWVKKERTKLEMAGRDLAFINSYSISGFFARSAINDLCAALLERKRVATKKTSLRVGINTDGGHFEWKDVDVVKSLDHIFFSQKAELVRDLDAFVQKKEFYRQKGINFKRSYLLYGPGGTGKTSLASALAKHLDYALLVVNLASIKDDLVLQRMGTAIGKKSVILLEDVDCLLTKREVKNDNLNFSTVLNFLDGLYAPSDCVFVLTTNKPEVLDDALIRKGRVDLALHIDFPEIAEVEAFMSDFYEADIRLPLAAGRAHSGMAEVQDICLRNSSDAAITEICGLFVHTNGHKPAGAAIVQ